MNRYKRLRETYAWRMDVRMVSTDVVSLCNSILLLMFVLWVDTRGSIGVGLNWLWSSSSSSSVGSSGKKESYF
jgi:hypothetical protein